MYGKYGEFLSKILSAITMLNAVVRWLVVEENFEFGIDLPTNISFVVMRTLLLFM